MAQSISPVVHQDDMGRKELVPLVCRAFALFFTSSALIEALYLPERLFALSHHISERSVLATHDYWTSYYSIATAFLVVRIAALLFAAILFWKCGPQVQALLLPPSGNQE
jgi:hypothetical protein